MFPQGMPFDDRDPIWRMSPIGLKLYSWGYGLNYEDITIEAFEEFEQHMGYPALRAIEVNSVFDQIKCKVIDRVENLMLGCEGVF